MTERHLITISGHDIDLLPFAEQILQACPYKTDLTTSELVAVMVMCINHKYVSVAWQDRVENRKIDWLTSRMWAEIHRIVTWPQRLKQLTDPEVLWFRPCVEVTHLEGFPICLQAQSMCGRWLHPEDLVSFPLSGCTIDRCTCDYASLTRRQGAQRYPDREAP